MAISDQDKAVISRLVRDSLQQQPPRPVSSQTFGTISATDLILSGAITQGTARQPKITTRDIAMGPPAGAVDGDIWIATNLDGNGARWQLQYNASSSSPYKWEFIGGTPIHSFGSGAYNPSAANTWTAIGVTITAPRDGDYLLHGQGSWDIYNPTGGARYFTLGSFSPLLLSQVGWTSSGATGGGFESTTGDIPFPGVVLGQGLSVGIYSPDTRDTVVDVYFSAQPIRIS